MPKWYVSRQSYYYSGENVVEIAEGGLDYSGSDMLVAQYRKLGEGDTFNDPREAVTAAIAICRQWRKDCAKGDKWPYVAHGHTLGMGLELESDTFEGAVEWANRRYESLEKCAQCGEVLPEHYYYNPNIGDEKEFRYCREYCVEQAMAEDYELNAECED